MIGTQPGASTYEHWLVLNEDGGLMYEIFDNTIDDTPIRINGPLSEYGLTNEECANFEVHRKLIAYLLATDDFQLVVRPVQF